MENVSILFSRCARTRIKGVLRAAILCSLGGFMQGCDDSGISPYAPEISYQTRAIVAIVDVAIRPDSVQSEGGAVSGYSVSPPLPAGLSLHPGTGIISGVPTAATPDADYVVTARGPKGSDTAVVSITVYAPLPAALMAKGKDRFENICAFCHGDDALGYPDQTPTLANSDYLMADRDRAIRVQLIGLPNSSDTSKTIWVNGTPWNKEMPAQNASDSEIAAVLTYVRANFNSGDVRSLDFIRVEEVARVRDSLLERCAELHDGCDFFVDPEH